MTSAGTSEQLWMIVKNALIHLKLSSSWKHFFFFAKTILRDITEHTHTDCAGTYPSSWRVFLKYACRLSTHNSQD